LAAQCYEHQAAATGGPAKDAPITPWTGNCIVSSSRASVKGGPMNVLKPERKLAILSGLVEGCSLRSISRMTGAHLETILKVLVETGAHCQQLLDDKVRGLHCEAVECDELWSFVQKKQAMLTLEDRQRHPEFGDCYTFVALDPASKVVVSFLVGKRDVPHTKQFIADLSQRIDGNVQLSTDGFRPYIQAIQDHFGFRATHAELIKMYAAENPGPGRYAPPKVTGVAITERWGIPQTGVKSARLTWSGTTGRSAAPSGGSPA